MSDCQNELHAVIAFCSVLFRVPFTSFYRQLACVHDRQREYSQISRPQSQEYKG